MYSARVESDGNYAGCDSDWAEDVNVTYSRARQRGSWFQCHPSDCGARFQPTKIQ